MRHVTLVCLLLLSICPGCLAQNTGGVFGPVVNEDHRSVQYRWAYDEENHLQAHRLHYQQAVNGNLQWRIIAQRREVNNGNNEHDFIQGEILWQLPDISDNWRHGLRFDLFKPDDERPAAFGVHWTNELQLNDKWLARFLLMSAVQAGENREPGIITQTRASLNYRYSPRIEMNISMFNAYGRVNNLPDLADQRHQIGPAINFRFGDGWQVSSGYLRGLTAATPNHTFRLWFAKSL